ncbi:ATP-binding protein [Schinkia azotoformans]|uniref:histidine kinase n=1 Tax=Schinkia azotoformans LMG 9581 TaxID=1131731 RepID=K6C7Q0_SCHAZ|nr:ATP-binding protein [Schinkia azotoformans]EKN67155.1 GAF sensor signal transduction histidine kinase [Schinkia azotoformans LMG 9581]MEC1639862.1 ATP-binding protein [Schinkia azotoformans]MEC1719752.1 ATP-binding protein [Schinkia azotoformans]MEC1947259.1 ATP-binding protein [Schinkia azotoformans]MED4352527.1 ATP-binding protein [Schinkia azotoformans]
MSVLKSKQEMIDLLTGVKASKRNYYTELIKTNAQLKKKNMKLEIINDVMKSFNVDMCMDDMLKNILNKLKELYTFNRLSLSIYEDGHLILTNVFPSDSFFVKVGEALPRQYSTYWNVIEQRNATQIQFPNPTASSLEQETFGKLHIKSVFLFPLISKKKIIGVLSFGSRQMFECEENDILFLQQLADQLAVCIENSRLYNEVLRGNKEWEETFRSVLDMIILVDMNGTILRFNNSVNKFFGLSDQQLFQKKCNELLREHLTLEEECLLEESLRTNTMTNAQIKFNNNRICDVYTYPVYNDRNEKHGVILYMKDVTEKLHAEVQLIQSGKLAALGEMAAGVAHELNSPLTAILGNSQLLLRGANKAEASYKLLEDIKNCGDRCKNIIRNLLTFSRQDEYVPKECYINEAVIQVLSLIRYQIERQNIKITIELSNEIPAIAGNLQQIEQIVINLLLNAKDAVEASTFHEKWILIETDLAEVNGESFVSLSVMDNGIGIAESDISEIFRPFYTTKQQSKGTGLGLPVSLGIAKMHGGTIEVESQVGVGSTFTLFLPVCSGR